MLFFVDRVDNLEDQNATVLNSFKGIWVFAYQYHKLKKKLYVSPFLNI